MRVGVPKEGTTSSADGASEHRVALTPDAARELVARGFDVVVAAGAGDAAGFPDDAYRTAGATLGAAWDADVVVKVEPPTRSEIERLNEGATLISFIWPARHPDIVTALSARGVTALAMDRVPRSTIAQKCDALSSIAGLIGYRAVIEGAAALQRPLGAHFSAAGKIGPAKVLVIGAGVAGLAAIGAAKALGASVYAFDTRRASREEVQSLGGNFLEIEFKESGEGHGGYAKVMSPEFIAAEMEIFRAQAPSVDVVITTALVPGTTAPTLWTRTHVEAMRPGSVVVDLAASQGGNCELTKPGGEVVRNGVTVLGPTNLASRMATTASALYAQNLLNLFTELGGPSNFRVGLDHPIIGPMVVLFAGATPASRTVQRPDPASTPTPAPTASVSAAPARARPADTHRARYTPPPPRWKLWFFTGLGLGLAALWTWLRLRDSGSAASFPMAEQFLRQLTLFVMACFVGWQVIWNVSPALHTPLMSVTNAISGIIIVGGLVASGESDGAALVCGLAATILAAINIGGGFWVTHRMLRMFRKRGD